MSFVAFECFADQDLFLFLKDVAGLPIRKRHSYSQGEVINDLLERDLADIAIVDEDPGASHHRLRDSLPVVETSGDIEIRARGAKSIVIVRPDLEKCFLRGMGRLNLKSDLTRAAGDLHRRLAQSNSLHADHRTFREDLARLRQAAHERRTHSFVTAIEAHVRSRLTGS